MATMLGFVTTDAAVPQPLLDRALREAVDDTFNAITVDGECSTNDCVMLLANGASGVDGRRERATTRSSQALRDRLPASWRSASCAAAKARPSSSPSPSPARASAADARRAAKAIANSPLVKTAIHGGDPNWGRLIAVAGRAGVAFELSRAAVTIGSIVLFRDGRPYDEAAPRSGRVSEGQRHRRVGRSRRRHARRPRSGPATSAPSTCASTRSIEPDSMTSTPCDDAARHAQGLPVDPRLRARRPRALPASSPRR